MKIRTEILPILAAVFMLSGCRLHRPDDVMSPKQMESFLYDYHLAQAVAQELPGDRKYSTPAYMEWAYTKHKVSKSDVERSLVWYTRYPKELSKIYKHLSIRVTAETKQAQKAASQIAQKAFSIPSGDSVDLWYLNRTCLLNTSGYMNKVLFQTGKDTTFHTGDTVVWSLNSTFVCPDDGVSRWSYMSLSALYPDSTSTTDTVLDKSGPARLSLVLDDSKTIAGLRAFIVYCDSTDNRQGIMAASDIEMVRYHRKAVRNSSLTAGTPELGADDGGSDGNVQ